MKRYFINRSVLLISSLIFSSCDTRSSVKPTKSPNVINSPSSSFNDYKNNFDTIIYPFGDSSYYLRYTVYNLKEQNENKKNACLKLVRRNKLDTSIILLDSLYCMYPLIKLQDFNNDKIKDVSIFFYNGGRANPSYHLYIVDLTNKLLQRVKGFESLPSPEFDSVNNVITTTALAGEDVYFDFFRINKTCNLTNLNHAFKSSPNDSLEFINVLKQIKANKN